MECGLAGWGVGAHPLDGDSAASQGARARAGLTPASHLKLADEQTVVACAAMLNACERAGWAPTTLALGHPRGPT